MPEIKSKSTSSIENAVDIYGDTLYRISLVILKNESDAEDAVQETFLKYLQKNPEFENAEHEKAWLTKVAVNKCRDMLRMRKRNAELKTEAEDNRNYTEISPIIEAMMSLPEKYRVVLQLHYIEDMKIDRIAKIINRTPSAVKMRLQKGRKLLEETYREEFC